VWPLLPRDWNRQSGRPHNTWLRTVESDLALLNTGLTTACHRAQSRQACKHARRNDNVHHRTSRTMMITGSVIISTEQEGWVFVRSVCLSVCQLCAALCRITRPASLTVKVVERVHWEVSLSTSLRKTYPLPSSCSRRHPSYDDCLEDKRGNNQNCSVMCWVRQLYTVIRRHISRAEFHLVLSSTSDSVLTFNCL